MGWNPIPTPPQYANVEVTVRLAVFCYHPDTTSYCDFVP